MKNIRIVMMIVVGLLVLGMSGCVHRTISVTYNKYGILKEVYEKDGVQYLKIEVASKLMYDEIVYQYPEYYTSALSTEDVGFLSEGEIVDYPVDASNNLDDSKKRSYTGNLCLLTLEANKVKLVSKSDYKVLEKPVYENSMIREIAIEYDNMQEGFDGDENEMVGTSLSDSVGFFYVYRETQQWSIDVELYSQRELYLVDLDTTDNRYEYLVTDGGLQNVIISKEENGTLHVNRFCGELSFKGDGKLTVQNNTQNSSLLKTGLYSVEYESEETLMTAKDCGENEYFSRYYPEDFATVNWGVLVEDGFYEVNYTYQNGIFTTDGILNISKSISNNVYNTYTVPEGTLKYDENFKETGKFTEDNLMVTPQFIDFSKNYIKCQDADGTVVYIDLNTTFQKAMIEGFAEG